MSEKESGVVRYQIDVRQSKFTVQAFAGGILAGLGHNPTIGIREFIAEAQFMPGTLSKASLRLEIKAGSLVVLDDIKQKDRLEIERTMHYNVLETHTYPDIFFQSTNITPTRVTAGRYRASIIGDLSLHSVTRNGLCIHVKLTIDGDSLQAQGDFTLKQTDYGIKLVSVAGGTLKLKDELKFSFDLVGHQIGIKPAAEQKETEQGESCTNFPSP
jgi:polyisoprenoid-binding protein YceI